MIAKPNFTCAPGRSANTAASGLSRSNTRGRASRRIRRFRSKWRAATYARCHRNTRAPDRLPHVYADEVRADAILEAELAG